MASLNYIITQIIIMNNRDFFSKRFGIFFLLGPFAYASSSKSFIYSLYNINGFAPVKLQVKSGRQRYAICRFYRYGPTFGGGHDIYISNNAASNRHSFTHCGNTYPLPPGYSSSGGSCKFYAGSYKFTPTDVEVFYETTT